MERKKECSEGKERKQILRGGREGAGGKGKEGRDDIKVQEGRECEREGRIGKGGNGKRGEGRKGGREQEGKVMKASRG